MLKQMVAMPLKAVFGLLMMIGIGSGAFYAIIRMILLSGLKSVLGAAGLSISLIPWQWSYL
ncbi:MAG: hypothetical protein SCK57_11755 [Bacillota bacterium]|nr:hypothetical protein [Bacillota bacterium]